MPNGISCAFFAGRNLVYGKTENNVFKEGIGCAQTVRTADTIAQTATVGAKVAAPVKSALSKAASIARKIVYPLIIGSGVYNTLVSNDKVKTGASQAGGIGTMYAFEQIAENSLKTLDKKVLNTSLCQTNKFAKIAWYVAKGMAFVGASLIGYDIGSSSAEKLVDKSRAKKAQKLADQNNVFKEMQL